MVKGTVGDRVRWVQRRLGIPQTGVYDPVMERALGAFQRARGLPPNGVIDPQTFAYLCWVTPATASRSPSL
jgi:murein L,D-transpeptidase YcbB/YkuD